MNKVITFLLATNGLILFAGALFGPIYAIFVEEIGGSILDVGLAGSAYAFAAGLTCYAVGKKSDGSKYKKEILALGYITVGAGYLLYIAVDSIATLLVAQVIIGFGEAVYSPVFDALYSQNLDKGKFSSQWGAWECMNYWILGLAAIIGATIVTVASFTILFLCMSALSLTSAVCVYLWKPEKTN